jgi:hypothetical protein
MGIFTKKNSKEPPAPKLTTIQRLVLTVWVLLVTVFSMFFFRRFGARVMLLMCVVMPVLGLLFGLRMLDKIDRLAKALGLIPAEPKPKPPSGTVQYQAFIEFLRTNQERGEFTRAEFETYCMARSLDFDSLLELGRKKGWFRQMGSALVITSVGMEVLATPA